MEATDAIWYSLLFLQIMIREELRRPQNSTEPPVESPAEQKKGHQ